MLKAYKNWLEQKLFCGPPLIITTKKKEKKKGRLL